MASAPWSDGARHGVDSGALPATVRLEAEAVMRKRIGTFVLAATALAQPAAK